MMPADAPFVIEHRHIPLQGRDFRPEAKLLLTPALRTSGLLTALTGETALPLLALLTFVTPNGRVAPSLHELGPALGLSANGVRDFMAPLTRLIFHDSALAIAHMSESGIEGYLLSPKVFAHVDIAPPETTETTPQSAGYTPAGREAVIAASRARYARPRAEVEREIEQALGHHPADLEETPAGEARRRLYTLGVSREEIEMLLAEFGVEEAQRQIEWLPLRGAKAPARFVVAAIRGRYEPPAGWQPHEPAESHQPYPVELTSTVEVSESPDGEEMALHPDDLPDMRWDLQ